MSTILKTFLNSPNAITAVCIGSWGVTSTSIEDMIHHPIQSVFWPLVCGSVAGSWISSYTPDGFSPYVAGGIITVTCAGLIARCFGSKPKAGGKHWTIDLVQSFTDEKDKLKLSYTAHTLFEDKGLILETENNLTPQVVKTVLLESLDRLDAKVVAHIDKIISYLEKAELLDKMCGVFVHDTRKGYVMINGPNKEGKHILSVTIA